VAASNRPCCLVNGSIEREAEAELFSSLPAAEKGAKYLNFELVCTDAFVRSVHQAYLPIVAASTRASTPIMLKTRNLHGVREPHDHHNRNTFTTGQAKEIVPQYSD